MGSQDSANEFFETYWPSALSIQDPQQILYKSFGLTWGSLKQFIKPALWRSYFSAREFGVGKPVGNTMRNPGAFLIHNEQIVHTQDFEHFGVLVDFESFRDASLELA